jgi:hypothetical protein
MKSRERFLRTLLVFGLSPFILALIALITALRPLTAYEHGFHGPDEMWRDVRAWARTGELRFPSWQRATQGRLHRHGTF